MYIYIIDYNCTITINYISDVDMICVTLDEDQRLVRSALPAAVQASPPALTATWRVRRRGIMSPQVVEMPGEYQDGCAVWLFLVTAQFVNNSIMCIGNIPDGTGKRSTWRQALCCIESCRAHEMRQVNTCGPGCP